MFNFEQCHEFYPESEEVEFRLAGIHLKTHNTKKGLAHLQKALDLNYDHYFIIEELFPSIYQRPSITKIISEFKKASG
jgi:hypothetical protein